VGHLSAPLDHLNILPCDLPLELWLRVAHHFSSVKDLIALGSISACSWTDANGILKYTHVGSSRIVSLKSNMPSDKPAEFEIVHDEELTGSCKLITHREKRHRLDETILDEGEIYL
jgi:hypothetical protein